MRVKCFARKICCHNLASLRSFAPFLSSSRQYNVGFDVLVGVMEGASSELIPKLFLSLRFWFWFNSYLAVYCFSSSVRYHTPM